jgi:hypothetical protein
VSEQNLTEVPNLAALRVSNKALQGEKLPSQIKVLNWGDNESIKGTFKAGEKTAQLLELNQRALGFERVAIDYNHCSVPGSPEYTKGKPPAIFGYGAVKVRPGEGVFLEEITWTPLGLSEARNFEDISPAIHPDKPDTEVDFIHSVALTPNGALKDVTFFSAAGGQLAALAEQSGPLGETALPEITKPPTKNIMAENENPQPGAPGIITLALMASALGLAATAGEAEVTAKLKKLSTLETLEDRLKKLEEGQVATLNAAIEGRLKTLEETINSSAKSIVEREKGEVIARFSADGKVPLGADGKALSDEELRKLDLVTLRMLHANTPSTVPLSARGKRPQEGSASGELKGLAKTRAAFQAQFDAATKSN